MRIFARKSHLLLSYPQKRSFLFGGFSVFDHIFFFHFIKSTGTSATQRPFLGALRAAQRGDLRSIISKKGFTTLGERFLQAKFVHFAPCFQAYYVL